MSCGFKSQYKLQEGKMAFLKTEDLELIRVMREVNLLEHIIPSKLKGVKEETGVAVCSDCHRKKSISTHLDKVLTEAGSQNLLHEFKLNGTALLLTPSLVTAVHHEDEILIKNIAGAITLGKIKNHFMIIGHHPCGAAGLHGLSLHDNFELMFRGRQNILENFPELIVSCFMHVDYSGIFTDKKEKTYHVDMSAWGKYCEDFAKYDYTTSPLFNLQSDAATN